MLLFYNTDNLVHVTLLQFTWSGAPVSIGAYSRQQSRYVAECFHRSWDWI